MSSLRAGHAGPHRQQTLYRADGVGRAAGGPFRLLRTASGSAVTSATTIEEPTDIRDRCSPFTYFLTVLGDGFARLDIENGPVGAHGDRYRLGDIKAILDINGVPLSIEDPSAAMRVAARVTSPSWQCGYRFAF